MKDNERAFVLIEEGIRALGFPKSDDLFEGKIAISSAAQLAKRCCSYLEEIYLFNGAFGLVSADCGTARGKEDVAVRHILDSLAPWREIAQMLIACNQGSDFVSNPISICDAGSGAGFPGIPLSLAFPQVHFTLVERMEKRCAFLQNCVAALSLDNVSIVNKEIERVDQGTFGAVVFRAFRPLNDGEILASLLSLLRPESERGRTFLAAYKGKRSSFAAEEQKMRNNGFTGKIETREIEVPFLNEQRLVTFIFNAG